MSVTSREQARGPWTLAGIAYESRRELQSKLVARSFATSAHGCLVNMQM